MGQGSSRLDSHQTCFDFSQEVELTINGIHYKVPGHLSSDTSLNVFIREHALLKGTKFMCLEGGCGTCIVSVQSIHPVTHKHVSYSVNSCMVPVFSCHGWNITTVEGLGSKAKGYHKIQKRLAAANGTQCGYCSPGMVMNMNSLLERNPKITMKEVENSFGGNICRCTGYRPILHAFKSLASDAPNDIVNELRDIEDIICSKTDKDCASCNYEQSCCATLIIDEEKALHLNFQDGASWYAPLSVKEAFEIFDMIGDKTYRLIAGNTGQGVYRIKQDPEVYIDINRIPELHGFEVNDDGITLGANINLTEAMELFYKLARDKPAIFSYCKTLADHIDLIANVPVRNTGTFAGNLSLKHQNHEFPSDLYLLLEMVGATIVIAQKSGINQMIGLRQYLNTNMNQKLIINILLPALEDKTFLTRSYKIMPRAQNAHAYVNAGFMLKVDKSKGYLIQQKPTILFGGINPNFLHAERTEMFLNGKKLLDEETLKGAITTLEMELKPDHVLPDTTPSFRIGLALSLFYKFILSVDSAKVTDRNKSGGLLLTRPISKATQDFESDKSIWPLNKNVSKIEALIQCSGEAEYVNDIPSFPNQVWGQFVLADRAAVTIDKVDPSEALNMPGVISFFSAKDIPGKNSYIAPGPFSFSDEPVFIEGETNYAGQVVGMVVAESNSLAMRAAKKVKITYKNPKKVFIKGREIVKRNMKDRLTEYPGITPTKQKTNVKYKIKGSFDLKTQCHFTMEPISCLAVPKEDHLEIYPTSQSPSALQQAVSAALNIPENQICVTVRRIGGGYGGKVTSTNQTAVACALAAQILHRPVRMVLTIETQIETAGKRFPSFADYETGVNEEGEIQYLNVSVYLEDGFSANDTSIFLSMRHIKNVYDYSSWNVKAYGVKTDAASNTWCRAPGSADAVALIENIMEHIASVVDKDPIAVRVTNINKNNPIQGMMNDVKHISNFDKRLEEIKQFNKDNRWKKRGISLVVMDFPLDYWAVYNAMVSVFKLDGTVTIAHGAVEMGQGVNTKAAQVAAHVLGIDLNMINIHPLRSVIAPNTSATASCLGSEGVALAVKKCCEELNRRLEPIKKKLGDKATWSEVVLHAVNENINMNTTYMFSGRDAEGYSIYGVGVSEVEVDILTGQYHTRRVDIIEDCGQSLSPGVDIGQIEGSFVMGLGYFTCEEPVYNQESGKILTNRTWNYKPPGAKDIPIDFRVTLRKKAPNPSGVLRSKATGEPPLCLSCSVMFAIRNALKSARKDAGNKDVWFNLEPPLTAERIWLGALTDKSMFKM